MGLGVLLAPLAVRQPSAGPGVAFASRPLLRAGVALLGLRISLHAVSGLGVRGIAVAVGVVVITMLVTIVLGRMLGVEPSLAILIGAGSAICGASAIAAMQGVARADEDRVGYAIGTVTLFGSIAMLTIPYVLVPGFGMSDRLGGLWAGASIHEVAQVAAAGAALSPAALKIAALMKLHARRAAGPDRRDRRVDARRQGGDDGPEPARAGLRARVPGPRRGAHGRLGAVGDPQHRPVGRDHPARRRARGARAQDDVRVVPRRTADGRCCWASAPGRPRCWCRSACSACSRYGSTPGPSSPKDAEWSGETRI